MEDITPHRYELSSKNAKKKKVLKVVLFEILVSPKVQNSKNPKIQKSFYSIYIHSQYRF
jgi:hypothetical protein